MANGATLTGKGQAIPREIRDSLSMKAGDRMTFTSMPDGTVPMQVESTSVAGATSRFRHWRRKN